ncbi:hypothetical protein PV328_000058 [Microctonus aethiopoides]|uniref:Small integral membrane protein 12 n=1 Tax=Microctonus aethiopoides TaxID=144406 RepID=A0AA39FUN6_9HYME|nr:hypothetical protein PV328_000058 [Microctonus aethiopoides]
MIPVLIRVLTRYVPYITLPFAGVIGFIGYHIESMVSDRYTPAIAPVKEQREERLLDNLESESLKRKHKPLDVNLSPSLSS